MNIVWHRHRISKRSRRKNHIICFDIVCVHCYGIIVHVHCTFAFCGMIGIKWVYCEWVVPHARKLVMNTGRPFTFHCHIITFCIDWLFSPPLLFWDCCFCNWFFLPALRLVSLYRVDYFVCSLLNFIVNFWRGELQFDSTQTLFFGIVTLAKYSFDITVIVIREENLSPWSSFFASVVRSMILSTLCCTRFYTFTIGVVEAIESVVWRLFILKNVKPAVLCI